MIQLVGLIDYSYSDSINWSVLGDSRYLTWYLFDGIGYGLG